MGIVIYMFLSNNPSSGYINSSNLSCHFKMFAWSVFKHAVVAAFCINAQSGEDAAKRGGRRQCIK